MIRCPLCDWQGNLIEHRVGIKLGVHLVLDHGLTIGITEDGGCACRVCQVKVHTYDAWALHLITSQQCLMLYLLGQEVQ